MPHIVSSMNRAIAIANDDYVYAWPVGRVCVCITPLHTWWSRGARRLLDLRDPIWIDVTVFSPSVQGVPCRRRQGLCARGHVSASACRLLALRREHPGGHHGLQRAAARRATASAAGVDADRRHHGDPGCAPPPPYRADGRRTPCPAVDPLRFTGGSKRVPGIVDSLLAAEVPLAGLWLQVHDSTPAAGGGSTRAWRAGLGGAAAVSHGMAAVVELGARHGSLRRLARHGRQARGQPRVSCRRRALPSLAPYDSGEQRRRCGDEAAHLLQSVHRERLRQGQQKAASVRGKSRSRGSAAVPLIASERPEAEAEVRARRRRS